ncbi:MAG: CopG family transcriptional regulator [Nitrososphaerota archaeon]
MPFKYSLGRKPRKITLRLPPEMLKALKNMAERENLSLAAMVRKILRSALEGGVDA